jgi:hypothetical protein
MKEYVGMSATIRASKFTLLVLALLALPLLAACTGGTATTTPITAATTAARTSTTGTTITGTRAASTTTTGTGASGTTASGSPVGGSGTASAPTPGQVIPFTPGQPGATKTVGQIPPDYIQGSGTIVTGAAADKVQAAAVAAYPGGTVDRVVLLSSGDYEVHIIAVNWPHHVFVNKDFTVIGAN